MKIVTTYPYVFNQIKLRPNPNATNVKINTIKDLPIGDDLRKLDITI